MHASISAQLRHSLPLWGILALGVALWALWSAWVLIDDDRRGLLPPLVIDGSEPVWRTVTGVASPNDAGLEVQAPGRLGDIAILVDLPSGFSARDFDRAIVAVSGASIPNLSLEWSVAETFSAVGREPVTWQTRGRGAVSLAGRLGWQGEPKQLMLTGVGFDGPWVLQSLALHPPPLDFWSLQQRLWSHLSTGEAWTVRDLNWQTPPGRAFDVSLPLFLAIWALLAMVLLMALRRLPGKVGGGFSRRYLLLPVVLAWLLLDLRWQLELTNKAHQSLSAFSGLAATERGRAEHDAELFEFVQSLEQTAKRAQFNRVLAIGDPYLTMRLRYRLAAWQTRAVSLGIPHQILAHQVVANDLVLLGDEHDFNVRSVADNSAANPRRVVVQTVGGEDVLQGEVILNRGQFWAIRAVVEPHRPASSPVAYRKTVRDVVASEKSRQDVHRL
mgnify:FL=1